MPVQGRLKIRISGQVHFPIPFGEHGVIARKALGRLFVIADRKPVHARAQPLRPIGPRHSGRPRYLMPQYFTHDNASRI